MEHLVIPVRDLPRAADDFRQRVGFAVSPGTVHASGTVEDSVMFADESYLELLGIHDPSTDSAMVRELQRILTVREGPVTAGVRVSSATTVATRLREAGLEVSGPSPTQLRDPATGQLSSPMYWTVEVTGNQPYLKDVLFFTEKVEGAWEAYVAKNPSAAEAQRSTTTTHPNTARRLAAAWLAVDDIEQARATYSSIGMEPLAKREFPLLEAVVAEIPLGAGSLMLAQSVAPGGPVATLLSRVGERCAMLGASVQVASLPAAQELLATPRGAPAPSGKGWFGPNVVVPPDIAHGAWIELFQYVSAP